MENKNKQFKPYDRVLVRDSDDTWRIDLYSNWDDEYKQHLTLAFGASLEINDSHILPFEGNEHLLGTTDEPEKEVELKKGEWIVLFDNDEIYYPPFFTGRFEFLSDNMFNGESGVTRELCVRFSEFIPADMEETKKHILCVKNGKIVRYKG